MIMSSTICNNKNWKHYPSHSRGNIFTSKVLIIEEISKLEAIDVIMNKQNGIIFIILYVTFYNIYNL